MTLLIELLAEAVLLGSFLGVLVSRQTALMYGLVGSTITVPVVLFLHGSYVTRFSAGPAVRALSSWIYAIIASSIYVAHMHFAVLAAKSDFIRLAQVTELLLLGGCACIVFQQAQRRVVSSVGSRERLKDECRDARGLNWLDAALSNGRMALRTWRRHPGFAFSIVLLLALGIGACTTVFTLFDTLLLRPLPVGHPEQLVRVIQQIARMPARSHFPFAFYQALHDRAKTVTVFAEAGQYSHFRMTVSEPAEEITVRAVTPTFFKTLGVSLRLGRGLMPSDSLNESGTPRPF